MESLRLSQRDLQHVEAYAEYRNIVGDTDDGVSLSEEEYERLRQQAAAAQKDPLLVFWRNTDGLDCRVVGPSSSCLCGHRYRDHDWMATATKEVKCRMRRCCCPLFMYIPVHGSRDIKCRCKHSYLDHDALTKSCKRCGPPASAAGKALPTTSSHSSRPHALRVGDRGVAAAAARGTHTDSTAAKSHREEGPREGRSSSGSDNTSSGGTRLSTLNYTGSGSSSSSNSSSKATTKDTSTSSSRATVRTSASRGCSSFSPPYTCSCGKNFGAHTTIFETASERGEPPPRLAMQTLAPTGGLTGMTSLLDGVDRLSLSQRRDPALYYRDLQSIPPPFSSAAAVPVALAVSEEEGSHRARETEEEDSRRAKEGAER